MGKKKHRDESNNSGDDGSDDHETENEGKKKVQERGEEARLEVYKDDRVSKDGRRGRVKRTGG